MEHVDRIRLSAFQDGETSEEESTEISAHLRECVRCQGEAHDLLQVAELLRATEDIPVSPYFLAHVKRSIREERSRSSDLSLAGWVGRFHLERIAVPIGVTALLLLSLLAGTHLGTSIHRGRKEEKLRTDTRFAEDLGLTAFDDFPKGSLGDAYTILVSEGGEE